MYFGTSTACVVAPSREGASPLPFGPQNKKLGNRCHNFILEILRPCAPYMAAIVTLFWGFWLFWLTFLLRQLQRVGNSKAKHWWWTTRGMSRNLCLFETPLQILYIHTFTEDLEGFPVSKKKKIETTLSLAFCMANPNFTLFEAFDTTTTAWLVAPPIIALSFFYFQKGC